MVFEKTWRSRVVKIKTYGSFTCVTFLGEFVELYKVSLSLYLSIFICTWLYMYMSIGICEDMYTRCFSMYIYICFLVKTIYHLMICMCIYIYIRMCIYIYTYHVHLQACSLHLKPLMGRQAIKLCKSQAGVFFCGLVTSKISIPFDGLA